MISFAPACLSFFSVAGSSARGDDAQVGPHVPRGERDEDVDHVVRQHGGKNEGPLNVRLRKRPFLARIAHQRLIAVRMRQGNPVGVIVEDEKGEFFRLEFTRQHLPDAPVTADDGMILDRFDVPGFSMFFHSFSYFSFGDELDQRADKIDLAGITGHDDAHGYDAKRVRRNRLDFLVTNRKDGDDDHVDGIGPGPPLQVIRGGTDHDDAEKHQGADIEAVHRLLENDALGGLGHGTPFTHAPCHAPNYFSRDK